MEQKLNREHLEEIQQLNQEYSSTYIRLGQATRQKLYLTDELTRIETDITDLLNKIKYYESQEKRLIDKLKETYGEGEINIETGTFTSAE